MIKHKDVGEHKAFQGYEASLKSGLIEITNPCDKMFQDSNMFPPKRGKPHEVKLQHDASLLIIGMNKMPVLENEGISK